MDKKLKLISDLCGQQNKVINAAIDLITVCTRPSDYDPQMLAVLGVEMVKLQLIQEEVEKVAKDIIEGKKNNE